MTKKSAILIDNDPLVRLTWEKSALKCHITLRSFASVEAFLKKLHEAPEDFSKDTPIYIDSHLDDGIRGEEEAENLYKLGFTTLFLETGLPAEKWNNDPCHQYIKKIIGKAPPWLS